MIGVRFDPSLVAALTGRAAGFDEAIARSLEVGPGIMPSYAELSPQKRDDLTAFLASLNGE